MKFPLEIKEEAHLETLDAYLYYESISEGLGEKFLRQLDKYFEKICENPENFQIKKLNYRELYIKKFPYLIIFQFVERKVTVYSVFNTYKNPKRKP